MTQPLLELRGVCAGYGESSVLDRVSLEVRQGEVVALLGVNGAGKTTTMRTITGLIAPTEGRIYVDGEDITDLAAHRRVGKGICLSPEGRQVFPFLDVEQNLLLGSFDPRARASRASALESVYAMFPKLFDRRKQQAGSLSGGEQQMLAIGRAMMGKPRVLLLDEPSLGLAPVMVQLVFDAIERIAASGLSILLVEQNASAALSVAHRGYVLSTGRVTLSDTAEVLRSTEDVRRVFLHGDSKSGGPDAAGAAGRAPEAADAERRTEAPAVLELRNVTRRFGGLVATNDMSFSVRQGEFVGIIGPNGAGKTTLLNLITGYLRPNSGEILLDGHTIHGKRPYEICRMGLGRTFQVVQPFAEMTVEDNVLTGALFSQRSRLSLAEARKRVREPLRLVGLEHRRNVLAATLTLGERKKLELARALATRPRILLLDEVMAGSTHGEVLELMQVLRDIHAAGTTIVMIEHLVHVILELAQRAVALNFGTKVTEGTPREVIDDPRVVEMYLGKSIQKSQAGAASADLAVQ